MTADPWAALRGLTAARIGLGRSGASLATAPMLALRAAQVQARDAVHAVLDVAALQAVLGEMLVVQTAAADRASYLQRPDLGRRLADGTALPPGDDDLAVVLIDGLSAGAVQTNAPALLEALLPMLGGWRIAPLVVVLQGRVAAGDAVAAALGAGAVLVLIGERPGLSAPDSLGAYLTWQPHPGTTDADRNCVSNIRPAGLPVDQASARISWLLNEMRARNASGVTLKDDSPGDLLVGRPDAGRLIEYDQPGDI